VHVLFALELFLLSPYARRYIKQRSLALHLALTAAMTLAVGGLLLPPVSPAAAAAFGVCVLLVTFACPLALVRAHKFKAHISGPWDEAAPHIPRELVLMPPAHRGGGAAGAQR
jgi:phosphatidylinositol glycan class C protein